MGSEEGQDDRPKATPTRFRPQLFGLGRNPNDKCAREVRHRALFDRCAVGQVEGRAPHCPIWGAAVTQAESRKALAVFFDGSFPQRGSSLIIVCERKGAREPQEPQRETLNADCPLCHCYIYRTCGYYDTRVLDRFKSQSLRTGKASSASDPLLMRLVRDFRP